MGCHGNSKSMVSGHISPGKHKEISAGFFSAVYGPIGTKLGRKVEGGRENGLRPLVSMVTTLFLCKSDWEIGKRSHGSHIGLHLMSFSM